MRSVNHHQLKQLIGICIAAQEISIEQDRLLRFPIMIWGYHGQGKTLAAYAAAKERGWGCQVLHTSLNDTADLIGRPYDQEDSFPRRDPLTGARLKNAKGQDISDARSVMTWSTPAWLAMMQRDDQPQILVLDELNRAQSRHVLNALLPLLDEGRIHMQFIKATDIIIATGNPDTGEFSVCDFNDPARISRAGHVQLIPDNQEVIDFIRSQGHVLDACLNAAVKTPKLLGIRSEAQSSVKIEPCPRLYDKVSFVLGGLIKRGFSSLDIDLFLSSFIGQEAALVLSREISQSYLNSAAVVLCGDFKKHYPNPEKQIADLQALTQNIARAFRLNAVEIKGKTGPLFVRGKTLNTMKTHEMAQHFAEFLSLIPSDLARAFYGQCCNHKDDFAPQDDIWKEKGKSSFKRLDDSFREILGDATYQKFFTSTGSS